jgi:hypothetical protein
MERPSIGDLFLMQEPGDDHEILVQYVYEDGEHGSILRVFRPSAAGAAEDAPCSVVQGRTWFYVSCPIQIAVDKKLAIRIAACEVVERPLLRRKGIDGTWYLRLDGQDFPIGKELSETQRCISPLNLSTPLAVLDRTRDSRYDPMVNYDEKAGARGRRFGKRRREALPQVQLSVRAYVDLAPERLSAIRESFSCLGWAVEDEDEDAQTVVLSRPDDKATISDLREQLESCLRRVDGSVDGIEVGPV